MSVKPLARFVQTDEGNKLRRALSQPDSRLARFVTRLSQVLASSDQKVRPFAYMPQAFRANRDELLWEKKYAILDQMRRHPIIKDAMRSKRAVLTKDWRVIPPNERDPIALDTAAFCTDCLVKMHGGFIPNLRRLTTALEYGFSVHEKPARVIQTGPWAGMLRADWTYRLQHFLDFERCTETGRLKVLQYKPGGGKPLWVWADECIHYVYQGDLDPWRGEGDLRACYPDWWMCDTTAKFLGIHLEAMGTGKIKVGVDEGVTVMDETMIDEAVKLIDNWQNLFAFIQFPGLSVENMEAGEPSGQHYLAVIEHCEERMRKAIGKPGLLGESEQGGGLAGGQAGLGGVQKGQFYAELGEPLTDIEELVQAQYFKPLLQVNGIPLDYLPSLSLSPPAAEDGKAKAEGFIQGVDAGVIKVRDGDEDDFRQWVGARATEDLGPVGGAAAQDALTGAIEPLALNGAQIASAQAIVSEAAAGTLPVDAAKAMLTSFLPIPMEAADRILDPLRNRTPAPAQPVPTTPGQLGPAAISLARRLYGASLPPHRKKTRGAVAVVRQGPPSEFAAADDFEEDPALWVSIPLPAPLAAELALPGGEPAENLHLTLAYIGRQSELSEAPVDAATTVLNTVAIDHAPIPARVQGIGRFSASETSDGKDVIYASVDAPGLVELRQSIARALNEAMLPPKSDHDFTPHITLAYVDPSEPTPLSRIEHQEFVIDRFVLGAFGDRHEYLLQGKTLKLFEAGKGGQFAPGGGHVPGSGGGDAGGGSAPQTADDAVQAKKAEAESARAEVDDLDRIEADEDAVIARHMTPDEAREYHESKAEFDRVSTDLEKAQSLDENGIVAKYMNPQEQARYADLNAKFETQHSEVQSLEKQRRELMDNPAAKGNILEVGVKQNRALEKLNQTTDGISAIADKAEARREKHVALLTKKADALEPKVDKARTALVDKAYERHEKKRDELDAKADSLDDEARSIRKSADRNERKRRRKKHAARVSNRRTFAAAEPTFAQLDALAREHTQAISFEFAKALWNLWGRIETEFLTDKLTPGEKLQALRSVGDMLNLDAIARSMIAASEAAVELGRKDASKVLPKTFDRSSVNPAGMDTLGAWAGLMKAKSYRTSDELKTTVVGKIRKLLEKSFGTGEPNKATQERLRGEFTEMAGANLIEPGPQRTMNFKSPLVQETTVRTAMADASDHGKMDAWRSAADAGFVVGFERVEDIDPDRNHPLSPKVNGLKIPWNHPLAQEFVGALHYSERGGIKPITARKAEAPGFTWSTDAEIRRAYDAKRRLSKDFV